MRWNQLAEKKWIVGVSGGPDSMALLDLCRRHRVSVVCAHVNYHHRPTADRDQQIVEAYCRFRFIRWIRSRRRPETFKPGRARHGMPSLHGWPFRKRQLAF